MVKLFSQVSVERDVWVQDGPSSRQGDDNSRPIFSYLHIQNFHQKLEEHY